MQILITLCLVSLAKLVKGLEAIPEDRDSTSLAETGLYPTYKRYANNNYLRHRYSSIRRNPDMFRFFHRGLGKRTDSTVYDDTLSSNDQSHLDVSLNNLKKMIFNKYGTITGLLKASQPYNDIIYEQDTKDNLDVKRAPESFSQENYPTQGGRQQLEVTMDDTLQNMVGSESLTGGNHDNPADVFFSAVDTDDIDTVDTGDIDSNNYLTKDSDSRHGQIDDKNENKLSGSLDDLPSKYVQKRWWAITRFKQMRIPRNQAMRSRTARRHAYYIDPAFYFLGLGK